MTVVLIAEDNEKNMKLPATCVRLALVDDAAARARMGEHRRHLGPHK